MPSSPPYYVPMSFDEPEESSASTVAATAVGTGHHTFRVQGYSRLETMHGGNGSYLESSTFKAAGHTWRVCCYLDGAGQEDAGFVSLFLKRAPADATAGNTPAADATTDNIPAAADGSDESVVHAEFEFALVHHRGTLIRWPSVRGRGSTSAFLSDNAWGFPQFISKDDLEGSRFLKDDCFAVRCKVTVVQEWTVKEEDARHPGPGKAFARFFCM